MNHVKIRLKNCYGIKVLEKDLDFSDTRAYALYAPNGVMKSSLAETFQDAANGVESGDRIFPERKTVRKILDENNKDIPPEQILVVLPYDEELGVTEKTSTLLVDPKLRREFDDLLKATDAAKSALLGAIKKQARSKQDYESEISQAFTRSDTEFDLALKRIQHELAEQKDAPFAEVQYDIIFNDKVAAALATKDLKSAVEDYVHRYNDLLATSTYFKRGTFDYYNAGQIAKSLADNGFFAAKHTVSLRGSKGDTEIATQEELEAVITREKETILTDKGLRSKFDDVAKQLQRNAELRAFLKYLQENEYLLSRMNNPDKLKEDVLKSYLKAHQDSYNDWLGKFDAAATRRKEIEEEARKQRTQWERVITIFNDRFVVPFKLEARNRTEVMLGQDETIHLGFTYVDGADTASVDKEELLKVLSTGERKALYVLNVIFEIERRKKDKQETLVVVDDLADSFDYQNKYAIIQYLKDISEDGLFKLLVMTHNFDFFRTLESRFVKYSNCLMASKNEGNITLVQATGIKNVFSRDWKGQFFTDNRKKIACIPFLRNLVEMTTGADWRYEKLTAMLHWKANSMTITVAELDDVYNAVCSTSGASENKSEIVFDLISREAQGCLGAADGLNLENKVVLAMAIRVAAEKYMVDKIAEPEFVAAITANQTQALVGRFRERFPTDAEVSATLDKVSLMTPENIHINSFMYEPIVDMSDDHLRKLYKQVLALNGAQ